ncbi:MAG: nicotinamide-nucleotide amidohydrolase family protein [Gammaproteobacteria bacterium]
MEEILKLSHELGQALKAHGWLLTTAESCTGGQLAAAITSIPTSSIWFDRGFITYSNPAKQEMLNVSAETLKQFGAVSEETVREMAMGALNRSAAQVSIAVSGVAGPDGGTAKNPVGTVWIAWQGLRFNPKAQLYHFSGNRAEVQQQAVKYALRDLLPLL